MTVSLDVSVNKRLSVGGGDGYGERFGCCIQYEVWCGDEALEV